MERGSGAPPLSPANRGPSSEFVRRRHERLQGRRSNPPSPSEQQTQKSEEMKSSSSTLSVNVSESLADDNNSSKPPYSSASPTAIRSFRQLRARRQNRVPGGAAAKLIGKPKEEDEESKPPKEEEEEKDDTPPISEEELIRVREEALDAFVKGSKDNRRYHPDVADSLYPQQSHDKEASHHSRLLSRDQALHENPTAAVLSLLGANKDQPRSPQGSSIGHSDLTRSFSREQHSIHTDFTQTPALEVSSRKAFQAPPRRDDSLSELNASTFVSNVIDPSEEIEATTRGKNPLEQPLLSKKAERRVAQMNEQMKDPNPTIAELISTIATPENHPPGAPFPRGYMVRRKNACGALQVMTAKNVHRVRICWTLGILPALSSVLQDSGTRDLAVEFPDVPTRKEFMEARKRAVASLMNLAVPPENRLAIFHTPHLVANMVRVITLDNNEARKGCCCVLAHLAKCKENRLLMVQVPGLIDAVTAVIEPNVIIVPPKHIDEDDDDEDDSTCTRDDDNSSTDYESSAGPLSSGTFSSAEGDDRKDERRYAVDVRSVPTHDPAKAARRYDRDPNKHLQMARVNVFALLTHLVKEKDNTYILARHKYLVDTLVEISKLHDSPSHEHAVRLLAHMTRHRGNSKHLVFKMRKVVPVLVKASFSQNDETRRYACFALQNLSQDKPCRQELAITEDLLTALCVRIRQASDPVERLSAIHALKNLTDEPANLIPMTNTPECFATLMQIAHSGDDSVTAMMQFLGCDALATLSHWFRSIATSGQSIDLNKKGRKPNPKDLFVPSLKIVSYHQWQ